MIPAASLELCQNLSNVTESTERCRFEIQGHAGSSAPFSSRRSDSVVSVPPQRGGAYQPTVQLWEDGRCIGCVLKERRIPGPADGYPRWMRRSFRTRRLPVGKPGVPPRAGMRCPVGALRTNTPAPRTSNPSSCPWPTRLLPRSVGLKAARSSPQQCCRYSWTEPDASGNSRDPLLSPSRSPRNADPGRTRSARPWVPGCRGPAVRNVEIIRGSAVVG
ncbi:MAG: hypothetical protein RIT19_2903 [Verrucomicrobiota bacterium]